MPILTRLMSLALTLLTLLAAGCGSDLPRTIPVQGRVTFDGGPCPASGMLFFLPVERAGDEPLRPATASFDTDGQYRAATYNPGDGLLPGNYQVHVECYATPPNMEGKPVVSHVPGKYQSAQTSGWEIEITAGMAAQERNFDVPTK